MLETEKAQMARDERIGLQTQNIPFHFLGFSLTWSMLLLVLIFNLFPGFHVWTQTQIYSVLWHTYRSGPAPHNPLKSQVGPGFVSWSCTNLAEGDYTIIIRDYYTWSCDFHNSLFLVSSCWTAESQFALIRTWLTITSDSQFERKSDTIRWATGSSRWTCPQLYKWHSSSYIPYLRGWHQYPTLCLGLNLSVSSLYSKICL